MLQDNYRKPFVEIGIGECPVCYKPLVLITSDLELYKLRSDGVILKEEFITTKADVYCHNCKYKHEVIAKNFTIEYSGIMYDLLKKGKAKREEDAKHYNPFIKE